MVELQQYARYAKQMKVHTIGLEGQRKLEEASCAIIGLGALGSSVADQLVRAGIGYIRIIDRDFVELSNLHRQSLYDERDAEQFLPKVIAAAKLLGSVNANVVIDPIIADVQADNIEALLEGMHIIVDCSDNFTVRYLINDYCVAQSKPWIYGAVVGTSGSTATIIPQQTPCFRCLFHEPPELGTVDTCDTAGVIAPIVSMIAAIQTAEVMKIATGKLQDLNTELIQLDCWNLGLFKIDISQAKRSDCPCCAQRQFQWLQTPAAASSISLCGRDTIQLTLSTPIIQTLEELAQLFSAQYDIKSNRYLLKVHVSNQLSVVFFPDQRIMVQGTEDENDALLVVKRLLQH